MRRRRSRWRALAAIATVGTIASSTGCTRHLGLIQHPPQAAAATTTGPWASMIYAARTDSGVIVFDLGWVGAERALRRALGAIDATPADVRFVFLTHAHRDHVAAWPLVRTARFVLGADEVPFFAGTAHYRSLLNRLGDRLWSYPHPAGGTLSLVPVAGDSLLVLGRDSVAVFAVPGHTPGSVAYLFRGILFGGDAINWRPLSGFQGARPEFSEDVQASRRSMRALWSRLDAGRVRVACSAHAKCGVVDSSLVRATGR